MSSRKFRLLIVPEDTGQVRQFQFHKGIFRAVFVVFMVCSMGLGLVAADYYYRTRRFHQEMAQLRSENRIFREELRRLGAEMISLREDMAIQARYDSRFRLMAQLPVRSKNSPNGVGGPTEPDTPEMASRMQEEADSLRRSEDLQRALETNKPCGWPTQGRISSPFGMRPSPFSGRQIFHEGIDIAARTGTPIHATAGGTVVESGYYSGYGNLVAIDHGNGYVTRYGHCSRIFVKKGKQVKKGEKIASVGSSGRSTGPHLHYEVHYKGNLINPKKLM